MTNKEREVWLIEQKRLHDEADVTNYQRRLAEHAANKTVETSKVKRREQIEQDEQQRLRGRQQRPPLILPEDNPTRALDLVNEEIAALQEEHMELVEYYQYRIAQGRMSPERAEAEIGRAHV
jgi:hypothetical protein